MAMTAGEDNSLDDMPDAHLSLERRNTHGARRIPFILSSVLLAVTAASTVLIACRCFVDTSWLRSVGWIYSYFIHAVILGATFGLWFVVVSRPEKLKRESPIAASGKVIVGLVCTLAIMISWVIVGFAVLLRM